MVRSEDLSEAQRAALYAIVGGNLAWSPAVDLFADGHDIATLEQIVSLGLAVWWSLCGEMQITLTPYGAWLLKVHIIERFSIIGEELEEDPFWVINTKEASSIVLPKRRHEIRWPWMDELPDPDAVDPSQDPEFLADEVSGKDIELFTQLDDGREVGGFKIKIDKRLKGAKQQPKRRRAG